MERRTNKWWNSAIYTCTQLIRSFDGYGGIGHQIFQTAKDLGRTSIAITDHDTTSVFIYIDKLQGEYDLHAVYGVELRIVPSIDLMRANQERKKNHITLLARTSEGVKNLNRMTTRAWDEGHYYKPTIDPSILFEHKEGVIVLSGCVYGMIAQALVRDDYESAVRMAASFKKFLGEDFYLEIQPHDLDDCRTAASGIMRISKELDIPMVMTTDVHFPTPDLRYIWRVLDCIRRRVRWEDGREMVDTACMLPIDDLLAASAKNLPDIPRSAIEGSMNITQEIAEKCDAELYSPPRLKYLPGVDIDKSPEDILYDWCMEGFDKRGIAKEGEYWERFEYEFDLVKKKDFVDYFLIIADMVRWAKDQNIFTGPARGSSAGSLMCYLIRITEVDPIFHGLMFERFISVDRYDLPDIDLDFEDTRREEVINYMKNKYGTDHVAGIVTFAFFKRLNILDEVGRVFGIPADALKKVKEVTFGRASGDSRGWLPFSEVFERFKSAAAVAEQYPIVPQICEALEWQYRHWSQHAAGIALSQEPLTDTVCLLKRGEKQVIGSDWRRAELFNILKVDILGLATMRILHMIAYALDWTMEDIYNIPLDDEKTIEGFKAKDALGIFQLDGGSTFSLMRQMEPPPENLSDISLLNSLSRPGPLHAGASQMYMEARRESGGKVWGIDIVDAEVEETQGFIVYQEQVMSIARNIGLFSWEDVGDLRKAISHKEGFEQLNKHKGTFYAGAKKQGIPADIATEIWSHITFFGSYGFNKSHSISYSLIAWQMMYLKQHYPLEFYWAMMCVEGDDGKVKAYMREFLAKGGKILPPRIGRSHTSFKIEGEAIRGSLLNLKGLGQKTCDAIVAEAKEEDTLETLSERLPRRVLNKTARDIIERYDLFGDDDRDIYNLYEFTNLLRNTPFTHKMGEMSLRSFKARKVTFSCKCVARNLKSVEEVKTTQIKSRTGQRTHVDNTKHDEWMLLDMIDDTGRINMHLKDRIWLDNKDEILDPDFMNKVVIVSGIVPPNHFYMKVTEMYIWEDKEIKRSGANCKTCPLKDSDFTPPELHNSKICFVDKMPGKEEIDRRKPLCGRSGQELIKIIEELGYKRTQFDYNNACLCRALAEDTNKNRDPSDEELDHCRERLVSELARYDVVIPLGGLAYKAVTGIAQKVSDFDGQWTKTSSGTSVMGTYHPSAILYGKDERTPGFIKSTIKAALDMVDSDLGETTDDTAAAAAIVATGELREADL